MTLTCGNEKNSWHCLLEWLSSIGSLLMGRSRCTSGTGAGVDCEFILCVRFRVWGEHGQQSFFGLPFMLLLIQDNNYNRGNFSSFLTFLTFQCFLPHQYVLTYNCEVISFLMNEGTAKARKPMPIVLAEQLQQLKSSWIYVAILQWTRKLG